MNTKLNDGILKIGAMVGLMVLAGSAIVIGGCKDSSAGNSPTPVAVTADDKIKAIEQSNMSEQNKQIAIAMVKSHFGQGAPTAPTQ
jgi:hypothetical protein